MGLVAMWFISWLLPNFIAHRVKIPIGSVTRHKTQMVISVKTGFKHAMLMHASFACYSKISGHRYDWFLFPILDWLVFLVPWTFPEITRLLVAIQKANDHCLIICWKYRWTAHQIYHWANNRNQLLYFGRNRVLFCKIVSMLLYFTLQERWSVWTFALDIEWRQQVSPVHRFRTKWCVTIN